MQKIKDFIYYNRKDIVLVLIFIFLFTGYIIFSSGEKDYVDQVDIEIEDKDEETKEKESYENTVIIDIKGEIKSPGTYELDTEKRVMDAILEAGGLTSKADTKSVNLSEKLVDEMVIIIPSIEEEKEEVKQEVVNQKAQKDDKISINTAPLSLLITINGIGESKAKNIIAYREKNGKFKTIEEIKNVSGIGDSTFDKIKDFIKV